MRRFDSPVHSEVPGVVCARVPREEAHFFILYDTGPCSHAHKGTAVLANRSFIIWRSGDHHRQYISVALIRSFIQITQVLKSKIY